MVGDGQELYREQPVYREAVERGRSSVRGVSGFSVLSEMLKSELESRITRTEFAQPANFIIQIGLLACLKAAGIEPGAVVGHSVGELASAYAAGLDPSRCHDRLFSSEPTTGDLYRDRFDDGDWTEQGKDDPSNHQIRRSNIGGCSERTQQRDGSRRHRSHE